MGLNHNHLVGLKVWPVMDWKLVDCTNSSRKAVSLVQKVFVNYTAQERTSGYSVELVAFILK